MTTTKEEKNGSDLIHEYLFINRTTHDAYEINRSACNVFNSLLQYPSLLSRFRKLRNVIQEKIDEFLEKPDISQDLAYVLYNVQELLYRLPHRSDYVE